MADEWDAETIAFAHRMFDLARSGATAELSAHVAAGLPANLTNDKGDTLLILAAYHNHADTVAALVAHGADPSRVNDCGQTALAAAVFRQSVPSVATLLRAGADPAGGSPDAVETAAFFGLAGMSELLRSHAR